MIPIFLKRLGLKYGAYFKKFWLLQSRVSYDMQQERGEIWGPQDDKRDFSFLIPCLPAKSVFVAIFMDKKIL